MTLASGSTLRSLTLVSVLTHSDNSGHTAALCSTQMLGFASHFVCPRPLSEIARISKEKNKRLCACIEYTENKNKQKNGNHLRCDKDGTRSSLLHRMQDCR